MAYSWDNRVDFVVRYMYDIDNNGFLDQNDFLCMAVRACVVEGKGDCSTSRLDDYKKLMKNLWEEISAIADDDKDGKISNQEFKDAVKKTCVGKKYEEFPQVRKLFYTKKIYILKKKNSKVLA
ncbi:sarcoplasmic calcium-binding protein, alpha-B and -A chains-like [Drosophila subpulchrella]|uniref:sarcoplasmic calcium-binding protein, alpha-B and -A chains-like n=1 Tax=Drosophila subpulchrella TaxID=1486046 RepID=UPI0018A13232|nr:sarcoplasmic calcium-binding protein, alpha-B and -A chains-like [Drosophila subpulchrella]XP_037731560.1 sarcoplasmic calcium-binding protein, alpha-B and -A chains-like [Drosophila subpulchrella]